MTSTFQPEVNLLNLPSWSLKNTYFMFFHFGTEILKLDLGAFPSTLHS